MRKRVDALQRAASQRQAAWQRTSCRLRRLRPSVEGPFVGCACSSTGVLLFWLPLLPLPPQPLLGLLPPVLLQRQLSRPRLRILMLPAAAEAASTGVLGATPLLLSVLLLDPPLLLLQLLLLL
jgi:hypothetical protein